MTIDLQAHLSERGEALAVPGVAVGIFHDGREEYAFHGVTSIENPLPVDEHTLFQFGSTGKTYTATAIMILVDRGLVDLHAPVRTYVPEFTLKDEDVARNVTVLQLLNHTAGWEGDLMEGTGDGDDAIAKYVANMAKLEQVSPLGAVVSYNNASLSVAGRVIEKVTGSTYEQAIKELIIEPLGMNDTFFFTNDIMTRRFAVGHAQHADGTITVARPWAMARGNSPAGGISSNAGDQIVWARFHLGDGTARDGKRVLSKELLDLMKQPTAEMGGSALGDYVGISWLMRDIDGVRLVGHGGDTIGQHSEFVMVPERGFAIAVLTNSGPNGSELKEELVRWALETYAGVVQRDPEPIDADAETLAPYAGRYETIAAVCEITVEAPRLIATISLKPETREQLLQSGETDALEDPPPIPIALIAGKADRYVVADGPAKGMPGYFRRDADGRVNAVHVGGRLATRVDR